MFNRNFYYICLQNKFNIWFLFSRPPEVLSQNLMQVLIQKPHHQTNPKWNTKNCLQNLGYNVISNSGGPSTEQLESSCTEASCVALCLLSPSSPHSNTQWNSHKRFSEIWKSEAKESITVLEKVQVKTVAVF